MHTKPASSVLTPNYNAQNRRTSHPKPRQARKCSSPPIHIKAIAILLTNMVEEYGLENVRKALREVIPRGRSKEEIIRDQPKYFLMVNSVHGRKTSWMIRGEHGEKITFVKEWKGHAMEGTVIIDNEENIFPVCVTCKLVKKNCPLFGSIAPEPQNTTPTPPQSSSEPHSSSTSLNPILHSEDSHLISLPTQFQSPSPPNSSEITNLSPVSAAIPPAAIDTDTAADTAAIANGNIFMDAHGNIPVAPQNIPMQMQSYTNVPNFTTCTPQSQFNYYQSSCLNRVDSNLGMAMDNGTMQEYYFNSGNEGGWGNEDGLGNEGGWANEEMVAEKSVFYS